MPTRIRTRTTPAAQCQPCVQKTFGPSLQYGNWGYLPCFPLTETTVDTLPSPLPYDSVETIIDETGPGRGIKECDHVKFRYPNLSGFHNERARLVSSSVASTCYKSYAAEPTYYAGRGFSGWRVPYSAYEEFLLQRKWGINLATPLLGFNTLPSRLGEVPSRVVAKLENLRLSQDIYELEQLASLKELNGQRMGLASSRLYDDLLAGKFRFTKSKPLLESLVAIRNLYFIKKYGLDPTISSVYSIAQELSKPVRPKRIEFSVALRGENKLNNTVRSGFDGQSYGNYAATEAIETERIDGCRVIYTPPVYHNPWFAEAASFIERWMGKNPYTAIWDVVPWSFVYDWFFHIDDALDNLFLRNIDASLQYWTTLSTDYSWFILGSVGGIQKNDVTPYRGVPPALPQPSYIDSYELRGGSRHYKRVRADNPSLIDSLQWDPSFKKVFNTFLLLTGLRWK